MRASEFYGAAAEIAVFDCALTAQEVSNAFNFNTADGGDYPHFFGWTGLVRYYRGDRNSLLLMHHAP